MSVPKIIRHRLAVVWVLCALPGVASAGFPPTVPPVAGTLEYYGTGSGYLCKVPQSPTGTNPDDVALAASQLWDRRENEVHYALYQGSGLYDGKEYRYYYTHPEWRYSSVVKAVKQYICPYGNSVGSPAYNCPSIPNSRNNPNECCPCGYDYNPETALCVFSPSRMRDCDQCQKGGGVPAYCDDGKACTVDRCDPATGCANTLEAGRCVCEGGSLPPVQVSLERSLSLGGLACPVVGGSLSASLRFSAQGQRTFPSCGNACASTSSLTGLATAGLALCSDSISVTVEGKSSDARSYVPTCDSATCGQGCGVGYCGTTGHSGSLAVKVGRSINKGWSTSTLGMSAALRCNGTLEGTGTLGGANSEVSNHDDPRGTCKACTQSSLSVSGGLGVSKTGCALTVGFRGRSDSVGCKECLAASAQLTGALSTQEGVCGESSCASLSSTIKLAAETPKIKLGALWWDVTTQCKASVEACGESRTCGTCACGGGTCGDISTKFSCAVCRSGSGLCQTVAP